MPADGGRALGLKLLLSSPPKETMGVIQPAGLSFKGGINDCPLTRKAFQVNRRLMVSGQRAL